MTLERGLAVRMGALDREMERVARMADGSFIGPAAEHFHQEVAAQRRLIGMVRAELEAR